MGRVASHRKHAPGTAKRGQFGEARRYNVSPGFVRKLIVAINYWVIFVAKWSVTRQDPHKKERGMDFYHDVVDWVGGYPYEHASQTEITQWLSEMGFSLIDCFPAKVPTGCNEFVFQKTAAA